MSKRPTNDLPIRLRAVDIYLSNEGGRAQPMAKTVREAIDELERITAWAQSCLQAGLEERQRADALTAALRKIADGEYGENEYADTIARAAISSGGTP